MSSVSCVLLLVERDERVHSCLNKALLLARHFTARLELLLCDTHYATGSAEGRAAEDMRAARVAEGLIYLQALCQTVVSADVPIGAEAMCVPSLAIGLTEKLRRTPAEIMVKAGHSGAGMASALEWQLAQCAVPLLLTAGRPWRAIPRFAAAVDLSDRADRRTGLQVVNLCEALAHRCGAELDYLFAGSAQERSGEAASQAHRQLASLLPAGNRGLGRLQYCSGEPAEALPRLINHRDYDLLALGGVMSEECWNPDSLAKALLRQMAGDVLLI